MRNNRSKIVATIGPASSDRAVLEQMIAAGMNVARLNFSHGNYQAHTDVIRTIRSISRSESKPVGIMLDLQGPKIRVGKLEKGGPVLLQPGADFAITTRPHLGNADMVSTTYSNLPEDVVAGDTILLDDGLIRLQVASTADDIVRCRVVHGGLLNENKGINLPGVDVSAPCLTEKDIRDVSFGIQNGVDYFALSFVRRAEDLDPIHDIMRRRGVFIPVIAKIEKPEAYDNFDAILDAADGIMVARGDLGVELNPEQVPTIQKQIIHQAIRRNKVVITATQMLETMSANPVPTRAEASDVANAIIDGTDAVMLSGETASGKYPVQAIQMMRRIADHAEMSPFMKYNIAHDSDPEDLVAHAMAQASVNVLHEIDASAIVAFSMSGSSAKQISKQRPSKPVFAFTPDKATYNRMNLLWGITPMYIPPINNADRLIEGSEHLLMETGRLKKGDWVVLVIGLGLKTGSTNSIKVHVIGEGA
jgi:pyruvate kinase